MRRDAPATRRNREPILAVLRETFPSEGRVIELGCGTGQHAAFFAEHFPGLSWLPTDSEAASVVSAREWAEASGLSNVEPGVQLDAAGDAWPVGPFAAAFSANVIHISPPGVTSGLIAGVGRVLGPGGVFVLYGPFKVGGEFTSASNAQFEQWLRSLDSSYGVKDMERVIDLAEQAGLEHQQTVPMPANNFCLVFRRPHRAKPPT
jgi:SAM-dependent methyltransferase